MSLTRRGFFSAVAAGAGAAALPVAQRPQAAFIQYESQYSPEELAKFRQQLREHLDALGTKGVIVMPPHVESVDFVRV